MVKSGLSSSGSGSIYIKPKDEMNDGAYLRMKVDGEMTEVDITALLIKDATVKRKGIVHFADDTGKEKTKGKAVQSSDRRLKPATSSEYGIVKLATSGENAPSIVVQGNDSRINNIPNIKHGSYSFVTNGKERIFRIEHEYGIRPQTVVVSPLTPTALGAVYGWDEKTIGCIFSNAPPSDSHLSFSWIAIL